MMGETKRMVQKMVKDFFDKQESFRKYWVNNATQFDVNHFNRFVDYNDPDSSILRDIYEQRELALELYANHPVFKGIVANITSHTHLHGYSFSCDTGNRKLDKKVEKHFKKWANKHSDATRTNTLNEIAEVALRNMLIYGESFCLLLGSEPSDINPYGVFIRGIDPQSVQDPKKKNKSSNYACGIQKTKNGVPQALHIISGDNHYRKNWFDDEGNPLVLHCMIPQFFGQSHGQVPATNIYKDLLNLSIFIKSEAKAAANASQINVTIESPNPTARSSAMADPWLTSQNYNQGPSYQNRPIIAADPGTIIPTLPGEVLKQFELKRPDNVFETYTDFLVSLFCRTFSVSREYIFADWKNFNFTAARLGAVQTQAVLKKYQDVIIRRLLQPATNAFLKALIVQENLAIDEEELLEACEVRGSKFPLLDPQREAANAITMIENKLSTKQIEVERLQGVDYYPILVQSQREEAEERELAEKYGNPEEEQGENTAPGQVGKPPGDGSTRS